MATWRSGYAPDCKSLQYASRINHLASVRYQDEAATGREPDTCAFPDDPDDKQNPGTLAGVAGAMEMSLAGQPQHTAPADAVQAVIRAGRLAADLGDALCDLPPWQARALLQGIVAGVEAVAGEGIGSIDGGPTRAELRASWQALEPAQDAAARARRTFTTVWNALADNDRALFIASVTGRRAAA